jgi:hypothetical protein
MMPVSMAARWNIPDKTLQQWIEDQRHSAMRSFEALPRLIKEQGLQEESFRTGGYAHRQILELAQNAADALRRGGDRGRVEVVLRDDVLYCANEGAAFTQGGLEAVCHAYLSDKRGDEMGRFGLGFKSVLGVTDTPAILSTSVSLKFSADVARRALEPLWPDAPRYPVLRLPMIADAEAEMASDPVLEELGEWAQTIVRLPLVRGADRLRQELKDFPKEFLLFAPYIAELVMDIDGDIRRFRCVHEGGNRYSLFAGDELPTGWKVWHQSHRPTEAALAEVGEAIRRPEVTVTYAVPLDGTQSLGRFWSYFPLQDFTSARGFHNAPWHISDDRTNLLPGNFNEELLGVVAELIVNALPELSAADDPARHFDFMPARGREFDNFGDLRLTELVPRIAEKTACIPDSDGLLRMPSTLEYPHADLRVGLETVELWHASPGRPARSPHPSCFRNATRRSRLYRLARGEAMKAIGRELNGAEWLHSLVPDASDEQCAAALQVYMSTEDQSTRHAMSHAAIIPDAVGTLHPLTHTDRLFLRGDPLARDAGIQLVRPSLLAQGETEGSLRAIGFEDVDPAHELRRLADTTTNRWSGRQWEDFWNLVQRVSMHDAEDILAQHIGKGAALKLRCRDRSWQHAGTVVMPGFVNPSMASLAVDPEFHDLPPRLLHAIGVSDRPVVTTAALADMTVLEYRRLQRAAYLETLPPRGRPEAAEIDFQESAGPAPLHVLRAFADSGDEESRVRWTRALLELEASAIWTIGHRNGRRFPSKTVKAPHLWAAQRYGLIETAWGPRPAGLSLNPDQTELAPMLPVATWQAATRLNTLAAEHACRCRGRPDRSLARIPCPPTHRWRSSTARRTPRRRVPAAD